MGRPIFKVINYHLEDVVGIDLSQIVSSPSLIEKGLKKVFGIGAPTIIKACIYAAFRAEGVIPDREYASLEDAFSELDDRLSIKVN